MLNTPKLPSETINTCTGFVKAIFLMKNSVSREAFVSYRDGINFMTFTIDFNLFIIVAVSFVAREDRYFIV
jgi:hypothetical protein